MHLPDLTAREMAPALRRRAVSAREVVSAHLERIEAVDGAVNAVVTRVPERALAEIRRVLRPGGRFLCLEFSRLAIPALDGLYDAYSMQVVPRLGQWIAGDGESYRYLVESIRRFPDQETFAGMLGDAGFARVDCRNLAGGIAAMHIGWRI